MWWIETNSIVRVCESAAAAAAADGVGCAERIWWRAYVVCRVSLGATFDRRIRLLLPTAPSPSVGAGNRGHRFDYALSNVIIQSP